MSEGEVHGERERELNREVQKQNEIEEPIRKRDRE